ncbi:hypothetical protein U1Q18_015268, partial [Sarracenia purpurea var. burkii]
KAQAVCFEKTQCDSVVRCGAVWELLRCVVKNLESEENHAESLSVETRFDYLGEKSGVTQ